MTILLSRNASILFVCLKYICHILCLLLYLHFTSSLNSQYKQFLQKLSNYSLSLLRTHITWIFSQEKLVNINDACHGDLSILVQKDLNIYNTVLNMKWNQSHHSSTFAYNNLLLLLIFRSDSFRVIYCC